MAASLDEFAQHACDDLLRDGEAQALLEAHSAERVVIFALANLPPGDERQRAFFMLGARFGNDPASGDAPLADRLLRAAPIASRTSQALSPEGFRSGRPGPRQFSQTDVLVYAGTGATLNGAHDDIPSPIDQHDASACDGRCCHVGRHARAGPCAAD
jgi:hypothetical protein